LKTIEIEIKGEACTGKSTIATIIARALEEAGITNLKVCDEGYETGKGVDATLKRDYSQLQVEVKTTQLRRKDELPQTMDIYSKWGSKIRYDFVGNGHPHDQETAKKHLHPGQVYTLSEARIGGSSTSIKVVEVPGVWFNSVMFSNV
jgi:hypothetical protein